MILKCYNGAKNSRKNHLAFRWSWFLGRSADLKLEKSGCYHDVEQVACHVENQAPMGRKQPKRCFRQPSTFFEYTCLLRGGIHRNNQNKKFNSTTSFLHVFFGKSEAKRWRLLPFVDSWISNHQGWRKGWRKGGMKGNSSDFKRER